VGSPGAGLLAGISLTGQQYRPSFSPQAGRPAPGWETCGRVSSDEPAFACGIINHFARLPVTHDPPNQIKNGQETVRRDNDYGKKSKSATAHPDTAVFDLGSPLPFRPNDDALKIL